MKDLFELWRAVFGRNKAKPKRRKNEGININPIPEHNPLPEVPPPGNPKLKKVDTVKKKDRIEELEREVAELRDQGGRQAELLAELTRQLSELHRDLSNILPEK